MFDMKKICIFVVQYLSNPYGAIITDHKKYGEANGCKFRDLSMLRMDKYCSDLPPLFI